MLWILCRCALSWIIKHKFLLLSLCLVECEKCIKWLQDSARLIPLKSVFCEKNKHQNGALRQNFSKRIYFMDRYEYAASTDLWLPEQRKKKKKVIREVTSMLKRGSRGRHTQLRGGLFSRCHKKKFSTVIKKSVRGHELAGLMRARCPPTHSPRARVSCAPSETSLKIGGVTFMLFFKDLVLILKMCC